MSTATPVALTQPQNPKLYVVMFTYAPTVSQRALRRPHTIYSIHSRPIIKSILCLCPQPQMHSPTHNHAGGFHQRANIRPVVFVLGGWSRPMNNPLRVRQLGPRKFKK